jgi:hypothetical protein
MDTFLHFASRDYWLTLALLLVCRGMDMLSTWVATPNLVLEGNPIARILGWRWGVPVNLVICFGLAFWPLPAIVISTTSVLVAARNFQSAWLMRSLGEDAYRDWHIKRIQETRITLYLFCLAGNTLLTAAVGAAVIYFSQMALVPFAIGVGITAYAAAVIFYTTLAICRMRRLEIRSEIIAERRLITENGQSRSPANGKFISISIGEQVQPQGK